MNKYESYRNSCWNYGNNPPLFPVPLLVTTIPPPPGVLHVPIVII